MTKEDLAKVPFEFVSHWNMVDQFVSVYQNDEYGIEFHNVTAKKDGFATRRSRQVYFYRGKKYKSVEKLLDAINNTYTHNDGDTK